MRSCRVINWDDITLPFGNPPSVMVPDSERLRLDIAAGIEWHWFYKGMLGILPIATMKNALRYWDNITQQRHRREAVPSCIGMFRWSETVSLEELDKLFQAEPGTHAAANGKPD